MQTVRTLKTRMRACHLRYTISISPKSCLDVGGVVTFISQDDAAQRNPFS